MSGGTAPINTAFDTLGGAVPAEVVGDAAASRLECRPV